MSSETSPYRERFKYWRGVIEQATMQDIGRTLELRQAYNKAKKKMVGKNGRIVSERTFVNAKADGIQLLGVVLVAPCNG